MSYVSVNFPCNSQIPNRPFVSTSTDGIHWTPNEGGDPTAAIHGTFHLFRFELK